MQESKGRGQHYCPERTGSDEIRPKVGISTRAFRCSRRTRELIPPHSPCGQQFWREGATHANVLLRFACKSEIATQLKVSLSLLWWPTMRPWPFFVRWKEGGAWSKPPCFEGPSLSRNDRKAYCALKAVVCITKVLIILQCQVEKLLFAPLLFFI